jgi:hypothetical protein
MLEMVVEPESSVGNSPCAIAFWIAELMAAARDSCGADPAPDEEIDADT